MTDEELRRVSEQIVPTLSKVGRGEGVTFIVLIVARDGFIGVCSPISQDDTERVIAEYAKACERGERHDAGSIKEKPEATS
jgi:hypothetical protein